MLVANTEREIFEINKLIDATITLVRAKINHKVFADFAGWDDLSRRDWLVSMLKVNVQESDWLDVIGLAVFLYGLDK